MNPSLANASQAPCAEHSLADVVEELTAKLKAGEPVDLQVYFEAHPQHAAELRRLYPALQLLADFSRSGAAELPPAAAAGGHELASPDGTLGDFRILREIGRGGMGVVYEAVQISLGRRVALKVLPFAAALDSKQLQRFKNEAQAAAGLQHTNIVPVYFVGCERGVHFYAMQFVEGRTLAALIQELRRQEGRNGEAGSNPLQRVGDRPAEAGHYEPQREARQEPRASSPNPLAPFPKREGGEEGCSPPRSEEGLGERFSPDLQRPADSPATGPYVPSPPLDQTPQAVTTTPPVGALSTQHSTSRPAFFRTVANLGIQAAEALEHAHQLGVIHRDIKPANLMVENVQLSADHSLLTAHHSPRLWITDFGLAHCQGAVELTMSGDLLGTLRYMSPEQALAQRVLVDQRTDIYSLGVTLYELLTLEPAFPGTDRRELLRQIAFDDPKPPRRLSKAIPTELETIMLKAMEKSPADRYATAQELADDLGRYLENKPIRARRTTLVQRARKWARRHSSLVLVGAAALFVVLLGSILSTVLIWKAYLSEADAHANEASQRQQAQNSLKILWNVFDRIYIQLMEIQPSADPEIQRDHDDLLKAALEFYQQFAEDSSTDPTVQMEVVRGYINIGKIHTQLGQYEAAKEANNRAIAIAEHLAVEHPADPNYQRDLAHTYRYLGNLLSEQGEWPAALEYFQRAIAIYRAQVEDPPRNANYAEVLANLYHDVGFCLWHQIQWEEAAKYEHLALDIQTELAKEYPEDLAYQNDLANFYHSLAIIEKGRRNRVEAEKYCRQAIEIWTKLARKFPEPRDRVVMRRVFTNADFQADLALSHGNLGILLEEYQELVKAEPHYREALRLWTELCNKRPSNLFYRSNLARSHISLADLLEDTGRPMQEVEEHYRQAWSICERLSQDFPRYYYQHGDILPYSAFRLGHVLVQTGRSKEAKEICRKGLKLARDDPETNNVLAWFLSTWAEPEQRDPALAIKLAKKATAARPKNADFWSNLGLAQYQAGNWRAALDALEESIRLSGDTCREKWFFAAMAHWKLNEKEKAREFYLRGDQGMRKGPPDLYDKALLRFRAEAAKLLEIEDAPAGVKEASPKKN